MGYLQEFFFLYNFTIFNKVYIYIFLWIFNNVQFIVCTDLKNLTILYTYIY